MGSKAGMEIGRGGSKMSKLILIPPYGTGLKSRFILTPPPLQGRKKLCKAKHEGASQTGQGKIAIPTHLQLQIIPKSLLYIS